ncbi:guanylate-binding protein 1-like [Ochotona curzoniae]|uniref:guanylate-binding protein 1-like n=1 Tax=Ochotona curzoniae TaxID=130825 RepID=UPI001B3477B5|nr:guanylate-binding protein 1-like [Ochotona curzoniae]
MESEIHMPSPMCLIENTDGQLRANQGALQILSAITQPVVVVAIVGLYRTGKSYLMNKLAGKEKGFSLGYTVQSHTKGIWMWCIPHPKKSDHTLILLDTEGMGDVEKGNKQNDCWIFALAILLSSTFVYNSIGTINQQAMDQLHFVTELTQRIRARSSTTDSKVEDSANFVGFFPNFVWTLRDFSLALEADGKPITADEYLENSLKLRQGTDEKTENFNEPRLCIRKFFPNKKCFIFDRPAQRKFLIHLEHVKEENMNPEFLEQEAEFCSYIFNNSEAKTLSGGITVNGPRLRNLVLTYVNAISSGDLPCMENAVLALAQIENSAAVQKAIAHYDQQMSQKVKLPTDTLQELLDLHRITEREAIDVFMKNSFRDVDQHFQKELAAELDVKRNNFCEKNEKESSDRCTALLQDIFGPLEKEVKQGIYSKPGGYRLFYQKNKELKEKYYQEPGKGIQADEILKRYLDSKEDVTQALLLTDQSLTEKEKDIEVERIKAEAAEKAKEMLQEYQKRNEQILQEKAKSYEEFLKQAMVKMEKDRAELMAEHQRMLTFKLLEQQKLLNEGFKEESQKLAKEIQYIKENAKKSSGCNIL